MIIPRHKICDFCKQPVGVNKRYFKIKSKEYLVGYAGGCSDNKTHHICEDCMHRFICASENMEFAKWVMSMIFDNQVKDFDFEVFSELACRKLEKMGLVEKTESEWRMKDGLDKPEAENPREDFNDYLAEQLKDPEFKKEWENVLKDELIKRSDALRDEYIRKEDVIAILNKWADGYCYIEIPTKDAIKEIVDFNPIRI